MNHYLPNSLEAERYTHLFQQGASEIITYGDNSLALWTDNTPLLDQKPIATLGGCQFEETATAKELVNYASEYLLNKFHTVVAPMNGNTWREHRLVTYSDGSPSFTLEPDTPSEWLSIFQDSGFTALSNYSSSSLILKKEFPRFEKVEKRLANKGILIRSLNFDTYTQELKAIYQLSCRSFKNNFLYTELSETEFLTKYESLKPYLNQDLVLLAEKEEQLVAFIFCYPDPLSKETLIVKTLASDPEKNVAGIGNILVEKIHQKAQSQGFKKVIHALQFDGNSAEKITSRYQPTVIRNYSLLVKKR